MYLYKAVTLCALRRFVLQPEMADHGIFHLFLDQGVEGKQITEHGRNLCSFPARSFDMGQKHLKSRIATFSPGSII